MFDVFAISMQIEVSFIILSKLIMHICCLDIKFDEFLI